MPSIGLCGSKVSEVCGIVSTRASALSEGAEAGGGEAVVPPRGSSVLRRREVLLERVVSLERANLSTF